MKKKIISLCLVVCLLAVAVMGGTMAYFTDTEGVKNVLKVGNVDIEILEEVSDEKLLPVDSSTLIDGTGTLETARDGNKVVDIANNGDQDAYVRLLIAVEDTKDVGLATYINSAYAHGGIKETNDAIEDQLVCYTNTKNDWLQIKGADGTVYTVYGITLQNTLAAGASTKQDWPLLKGIYIKDTADNAWAEIVGDDYNVLVLAQATQVIDASKTATHNIDTAFGFTMNSEADDQVAKLFSLSTGETFTAHNYSADGAWSPVSTYEAVVRDHTDDTSSNP